MARVRRDSKRGQATKPDDVHDWAQLPVEMIAQWSVLKGTVPCLFQLTADERDSIYEASDRLPLSALNLSDESWAKLAGVSILSDDPFQVLLSLTIDYLFEYRIDGTTVETVISAFKSLAEKCTGRAPSRKDLAEFPIIADEEARTVRKFRIDSSNAPVGFSALLGSYGLTLWGDVSGKAERDIFECFDSLVALEIIHAIWRVKPCLSVVSRQLSESRDYDSFSEMAERFVCMAVRDKEERTIMFGRLRLENGTKRTLQELGDLFGVTRERIRQIEARILRSLLHRTKLAKIARFRLAVAEAIRISGGACLLSELSSCLMQKLEWSLQPQEASLASFVDAFCKFKVDGELGIVYDAGHVCIKCSSVTPVLEEIVAGEESGLSLSSVAQRLLSRCSQDKECEHSQRMAFSNGFVKFTAAGTGVVIEDDQAQTRTGRTRKHLAESILLSAARPMHFSEVCSRAKAILGDDANVTERNVHAWLDRSDDVLLWDRGTFVHCDCVDAPSDLLAEIEGWLVERLKGGLPFVNVEVAYRAFGSRCSEHHLTSESALYTSLRRWGSALLRYPRFPQIYLASDFEGRIPAVVAIEGYIRDAGAAVPHEALKQYFVQDLGLKEFQLQQSLSKLSNVVRTRGGGFLDISLLRIDQSKLDLLTDYIDEVLRKTKQISAVKIFRDKEISCTLSGIDGPEMLHSVLRLECNRKYDLSNYPMISVLSGASNGENQGIRAQVVDYVRKKSAPCSFDEIESHFVHELGCSEKSVYSVAEVSQILRYGRATLIHVDSIKWTPEKESLLELQALEVAEKAREVGRCYALSRDLLDCCNLPILANGVTWTRTLLAALLERSERLRLIGSARNAFVAFPNSDGINTFEDLVREILRRDFGGASNLVNFEQYLQQAGIVQKRVTTGMLGHQEKVSIRDNLIMLTELRNHA